MDHVVVEPVPWSQVLRGTVLAVAVASSVVGCGDGSQESPQSLSVSTMSSDLGNIPNQTAPTSLKIGPKVGSCASLSGPSDLRKFKAENCSGSMNVGALKVVAVVAMPKECPTDVDQRFFYSDGKTASWTACMDVNWTSDGCIQFSGGNALTVSCEGKAENRFRATGFIRTSGGSSLCQTGGKAHPARGFVVCTEPR